MALGNKKIMAENIQYYLAKNGKMATDMIRDLEFKTTTVYDWINGRTYPRIDKIELMANYFGIEKSDLVEDRHNNPFKRNNEKEPIDLYEVPDSERDELVSAGGHPISDEDWAIIQAVLAKYPRRED